MDMHEFDKWLKEKITSDDEHTYQYNGQIHDAQNPCYAQQFLENILHHFEQGKFCDFTLVVGTASIGAHKLVLSSFSMFFRKLFENNWKKCEQNTLLVNFANEETLKCILTFAYTGKLCLKGDTALLVLKACDFLLLVSLDFVKESCSDFWIKGMNGNNCLAMLWLADMYNLKELKFFALNFIAKDFYVASQSEDFVSLPDHLVIQILKSDPLVVDLGKDFLPSPVEQEDFILDIVLKYISLQSVSYREKCDKLCKLLQNIRMEILSQSSWDQIQIFAERAGETTKLKLDKERAKDGRVSQPRFIAICRVGVVHANLFPSLPELYRFGNQISSCPDHADLHVKGLKMWIRMLENHPVISGLQVFYSNGHRPIFGSNDQVEVREFHLEFDERIIKAQVSSGRMINSLTFSTNKGRHYGPFGETREQTQTEESIGKYGFLSYLAGSVVQYREGFVTVTKLQLIWKQFLIDNFPVKKRLSPPTL